MAQSPIREDADGHGRLREGAARGGPIDAIHPGDVAWFWPNEKHWHGATATTGMTHLAIQEALDARSWSGWRSAKKNSGSDVRRVTCDEALGKCGGVSTVPICHPAALFLLSPMAHISTQCDRRKKRLFKR